jgi:hypothetical protein
MAGHGWTRLLDANHLDLTVFQTEIQFTAFREIRVKKIISAAR